MEEQKQVQFQYIFPEEYNPIYCNGAYGGVASQGEIIINFYLERMPIPQQLIHNINPDGSLSEIVQTEPKDLGQKIIRYVSSGVVLNEASARSIYDWLGKQLNELERRKLVQFSSVAVEGDPNG